MDGISEETLKASYAQNLEKMAIGIKENNPYWLGSKDGLLRMGKNVLQLWIKTVDDSLRQKNGRILKYLGHF